MSGDVDATRPPDLTVEAGQKFQNFGYRTKPRGAACDPQVKADGKGRGLATARFFQKLLNRIAYLCNHLGRPGEAIGMKEFHIIGVEIVGHHNQP